jgi:hypothetical protein
LSALDVDEVKHLDQFKEILFKKSQSRIGSNLATMLSKTSGKDKRLIAWCLDRLDTSEYEVGIKTLFNPRPGNP